jgi:ADP-heptose:LPS heptosyltransferase
VINFLLRHKIAKIKAIPPNIDDINRARKILFPIFTRYGDTIIDLLVIREFISNFPQKRYLILCPNQMCPYVEEFLPNTECIGINKRNIFDMIKINKYLKSASFDIGFNPWSNGLDSSFFLTYCKKFLFYKDFERPSTINHYEVVRRYLKLPNKEWNIEEESLNKFYKRILICPQSTDKNRTIANDEIDKLIQDLKLKYSETEITIASMNQLDFRNGLKEFLFTKTSLCSKEFIEEIKHHDLIICCDSGPLHIAVGLKKTVMAIMKNTDPKIVINSGSKVCISHISN